ncbi:hypothetical protein [Martelella mediterranea]|uniref:Uncharacterized protein n=1 Tax=Martelella mediterranea TaxID=293089 RepID=A0A4R3NVK8_9HYPH|nr:hypothetical protein [Martelella mediterranea]TCT41181.1 hypothetical protein EDC90_1007158 [Martelella mediterranea]
MSATLINMVLSDTLRVHALHLDKEHREGGGLSEAQCGQLARELHVLADLARNTEQELYVHRLDKAQREGCEILEDEATRKLRQMLADPDGKIVRPDFKGGKA